jgi:molybdopterin molybdotransferase
MAELVTIEAALEAVLARSQPLESETVALSAAYNRVLAEPAVAAVDLPPFPSSAMDGYAIRVADAPGPLTIVSRSTAGRPATVPVAAGEAIAVTTGAVVPEAADAVVPIELVAHRDNTIELQAAVAVRANIRDRGGDVRAGDEVVARGTRLAAPHVGALAAAGVTTVACTRQPVVRVLTTGSELRRPGDPLGPGEIYESNGAMLEPLLTRAGARVLSMAAVADTEHEHRAAIAEGLGADVLVTSGGVSVGTHDLVRDVERELGVEEIFWGVAMRPGKPLSFGVRGRTLVFGLPGNPVSSLVSAMLFVVPALLALQGAADPGPAWLGGRLAGAVRQAKARDDLLRARSATEGTETLLTPVPGQESHMIVRAAGADALVHVPRGEGELPAGTPVRYLRLD